MLNLVKVNARNIDEAHFKIIRSILQNGEVYVVDRGSYKGHKRLEFNYLTLQITNPESRPLAPIMPHGIPSVTDEESIYNYAAKYLMTEKIENNEQYTYGQYIWPQVSKVIKMFNEQGFGTNQAVLSVCDTNSIDLDDPPCLRQIQCKIINKKLHFITMWRSWDLFCGLPENLGGLQILKEYMSEEIGVFPGETIASCAGAHIYDYSWPVALSRLYDIMPENSIISKKEMQLGEKWMERESEILLINN